MTHDPLWESGEDGATPLSPEDLADLTPSCKHITLRRELNEVEAVGVQNAVLWACSRRLSVSTLLDATFILTLHQRMLGDVWTWAGSYRRTDMTIGVPHAEIPLQTRQLLGNTTYWIENHTFSPDEIAVRFHHRLVSIHPFRNGNGRLSRLMGDLLGLSLGRERFTWGASSLGEEARPRYIKAVRDADQDELTSLLELSRLP